jgi:hypothetical protein
MWLTTLGNCLMLILPWLLSADLELQARSASLTGRSSAVVGRVLVPSDSESQPVRRARVVIRALPPNRYTAVATTDTEGRFRFRDVPVAAYDLHAEKSGFVSPKGLEDLRVEVKNRGSLAVDLVLARAGALDGHLTRADGTPAIHVPLAALAVPTPSGLNPAVVRRVLTDGTGHFRLHTLPPGSYCLQAESQGVPPTGRRTTGAYYPGVQTLDQSRVLSLKGGDELADLDFSIPQEASPDLETSIGQRVLSLGYLTDASVARRTAIINGQVLDANSRYPLGRAAVLLSSRDSGLALTYSTDTKGRFEFVRLPAGSYKLMVSAEGHASTEYGQVRPEESGSLIRIAEEQRFEASPILLYTHGSIEGHVTDEFGDPAPDISVEPMVSTFIAGRRRLAPAAEGRLPTVTDDRGNFRFEDLRAGNYYLLAAAGVFAGPHSPGGFGQTYYPGRSDRVADGLSVTWGQQLSGVTFSMKPTPSGQILGTVNGRDGVPTSGVAFLIPASDDENGLSMARTLVAQDGSFSFDSVPWGSYTIQAFGAGQSMLNASPFGYAAVSLSADRLDGVSIGVAPGGVASGEIVFDSDLTNPPNMSQVRLSAPKIEFDTTPIGAGALPVILNEDGTFEIRNLFGPRLLRATIDGGIGWALARVELNGTDVTDTPLQFGANVSVKNLKVVLTRHSGSTGGTAVDSKGSFVTNYTVVAFSKDPSRWAFPSRFVATARPEHDGHFTISGLIPGSYYITAVPYLREGEERDPVFLAHLTTEATSVQIVHDNSVTLTLALARR